MSGLLITTVSLDVSYFIGLSLVDNCSVCMSTSVGLVILRIFQLKLAYLGILKMTALYLKESLESLGLFS